MILWWQNPKIEQNLEKYRALSNRERIMMVVTAHVIIAAIFVFFVVTPIWKSSIHERKQANEIESNATRLEAHLERLRSTPVLDPNKAVVDELEKLVDQYKLVESRIQSLTDTLVSPESMPEILEKMLTQDSNLKLLSLKNQPSESVDISKKYSDVDLFKHGVEIKMSADFPSLINYLKRLDSMRWKLYWKTLDYRVENYPEGTLQLEVFTLGTREEILSD